MLSGQGGKKEKRISARDGQIKVLKEKGSE